MKSPGPTDWRKPLRDALEEFVADQMSQRIVDALEFVDVDVEDRELGRSRPPAAVSLRGAETASGSAGWSARRNGRDARSLPGRDAARSRLPASWPSRRPASACRSAGSCVRRASSSRCPEHRCCGIEKFRAIGVDVADEGAELLAMQDEVAQMAAGFDDFGRNAEHVDILLVADHEAARGIEQQQALGHVVDGGVEMLGLLRQLALRGGVLAPQLAHDQEDHDDDDDDRERRGAELQLGLRPPVGERGRRLGGRDDQDRKVRQRPDRAHLVLRQPRAGEAPGYVAVQRQRALERRRAGDVLADQRCRPRDSGR